MLAWLAHDTCEVTGEMLDVGVGYVGRAFFAVAPGITDPMLSIESVRDNWHAIVSESGYRVPGIPGTYRTDSAPSGLSEPGCRPSAEDVSRYMRPGARLLKTGASRIPTTGGPSIRSQRPYQG